MSERWKARSVGNNTGATVESPAAHRVFFYRTIAAATGPAMKHTLSLLLLCATLAAAPLHASMAHPLLLAQADGAQLRVPLDKAVEQVRRETGGRILSATTERKGGRYVHRIKVLTPDKRVVIKEVNAGGGK